MKKGNYSYLCYQDDKNRWLGVVLFFLCPIASIPFLVYSIYRSQYKNLIWISLVLALIALVTPLFADSYRHGLQYITYSRMANTEQFFYSNGQDFIFYTFSHLFAVHGIPFEFIKGIVTVVCYQISFFLFRKVLERNEFINSNARLKFNVFLIFLLSVPFIWVVNGIRMVTAGYIVALGWYYLYSKKISLGVLCYIIAQSIHFSSIMFLPIMLYTIFKPFSIGKNIFIICFVVLFFTGNIVEIILPRELIYVLGMETAVDVYINKSKEYFSDSMSVNGFWAMVLERFSLIVIFFYLVLGKIRLNDKDKTIMYLAYLFTALFMPFLILYQKYCLIFIPVALFLCMINEKGKTKYIKVLTLSCFVVASAYLYGYREVLLATPFYKLLLNPFSLIFSVDTFESVKDAVF